MPVCPIREKRTRKAPAGLVPAIRHGETVVHEIAGRVQHVAEQLRIARSQVFRHFVVSRRKTGRNRCRTSKPIGTGINRSTRHRTRTANRRTGTRTSATSPSRRPTNRKCIIRTFHQTVAEGTDIFREALDRVAGLVEVRVGERCNQAVRPIQAVRGDFRRGVAQICGGIVDVRVERRGRGECAGTV